MVRTHNGVPDWDSLARSESPVDEKTGLLTPASSEDGDNGLQIKCAFRRERRLRRCRIFGVLLALLFIFVLHYSIHNIRFFFHTNQLPEPISFTFDKPTTLNIYEKIDPRKINVYGTVFIKQGPDNQEPNFNVTVIPLEVPVAGWMSYVKLEKSSHGLEIMSKIPPNKDRRWMKPRIGIDIHLQVRAGSSLEGLAVGTYSLDMKLDKGLELEVTQHSQLQVLNGVITSSRNMFHSRQAFVETKIGGIYGDFNLLEELAYKAGNGAISVNIVPKNISEGTPTPAFLSADCSNGEINIEYDLSSLPDRDYRTKIENKNGIIRGIYLHGTTTEIKSYNGDLIVDIVPYIVSTTNMTSLETVTLVGNTDVTVHNSISKVGALSTGSQQSQHSSTVGDVKLRYPEEWKGTFEAWNLVGSIYWSGKAMEIEFQNATYARGHRGHGEGLISFKSLTGTAGLTVGE